MFRESNAPIQKRIEELENELSRLRKLAPESTIKDNVIQTVSYDYGEDAVSVIAKDFTIVEVNDQRLVDSGWKRSDVIGKKCHHVFYGMDKPCEECTATRVIEDFEPNHFLKSYVKDNRIKFEEKYLSPIVNKEGEIERIVVRSKDISSYYHLVNKVGEREEFYKNIFESAGDSFLVHDEQGKLIEFSSRLVEMLGYTEREFEQLSVEDIDDPSSSMEFVDRRSQIQKNGSAIFETNLITKSGNHIPVEVSASLMELSNSKIYFVGIRNTVKRKIAERKLKESEERFRTLVENAPDLIMRFDRDHKHLFVNSASKTVLNIAPKEFIGKTHYDMGFPEKLCAFWEEQMNLAFETKKPHYIDFKLELSEEIMHFNWQLIPEFNEEGKCETLLGIARDITANKRYEEALNEEIKTKDKFFSIIAHDLKNPFNALLTIAKNLYLHGSEMNKEQVSEASGLIYSAATQEYNLLKNLLEWGRSQMGRISHNPREVDLHRIVESNIQLHQARAGKKNIETIVSGNVDVKAYVDEFMLDTVIRNLYSNALKFTKEGGLVKVNFESNGKFVKVHIEDNGIGISKKNQERLFRIDTNYNRVGTNEESGTGLGLILCKEFVEKNGGTITVESEPDKGSVFSLQLPKIQ